MTLCWNGIASSMPLERLSLSLSCLSLTLVLCFKCDRTHVIPFTIYYLPFPHFTFYQVERLLDISQRLQLSHSFTFTLLSSFLSLITLVAFYLVDQDALVTLS